MNTNPQPPDPDELIDVLCDELPHELADDLRAEYLKWSANQTTKYLHQVIDILLVAQPPSPGMLTALVDDLVRMDAASAIDLDQWPAAYYLVYGWAGRPRGRGRCECTYERCPTKGTDARCRNLEQLLPEGVITSPRLCMSCGYCLDESMDER